MSVFNASRLLGKTVLITDASAGIGAVCTYPFAYCTQTSDHVADASFAEQATAVLFAKVGWLAIYSR